MQSCAGGKQLCVSLVLMVSYGYIVLRLGSGAAIMLLNLNREMS